MTTVGGLRDQLARDLNDPELAAWTWEQLAPYLMEAVHLIVRREPEAFARERILELEGGRDYHPVCGCLRLADANVIGQCRKDGTVWNRLAGFKDSGLWPGGDLPSMPVGSPFKLEEFSICDDGRTLRVYPRIPPGTSAFVLVRCPAMPDFDDPSEDIDGAYKVVMVQWALYRAKMVDGESNPAVVSVANSHRDLALSLLGIANAAAGAGAERERRSGK